MTIKKKIYSVAGAAFFIFIVLALMNIWTHEQVISQLQVRDGVNKKLADIKEFAKWKNGLIGSISDIMASGHVPPYAKERLTPHFNSHYTKSKALIRSGEALVDLIGEKEQALMEVEKRYTGFRKRINDLYFKLDEKISTVLAVSQLDEVMGIGSLKRSSLAPYVLKSLNQLTLVALNSLIERNYSEEKKSVIQKNKKFLASQLHTIDDNGTIAALFEELLAQIESLEAFISSSRQRLNGYETSIATAKDVFDKAVANTQIDTVVTGAQSEVMRAHERLEKASRRTLVTIIVFLYVVPIIVIVFGIFGLNTIIVAPITDLVKAMRHVEEGNFDVTAPEKGRDEIGMLARAFNAMAREIKLKVTEKEQLESQLRQAYKMEAIGTLAGGIAHDFNNILSAISGYTELSLLDAEEDSVLKSYLRSVLQASERAKELVRQILTFSRQNDHQPIAMDLSPVVKESLKLLRASVPKTIEIRHKINGACTVLADQTQMQQVVMNLCTNAAQAMQQRGGVLDLVIEPVQLDENAVKDYFGIAPGKYVMLCVSDTGDGIEPGIIGKIFDPFFTTKGSGEGTGMGLSVVHGIVKSGGGAITVDSKKGIGSTFKVFLPRIEKAVHEESTAIQSIPTGKERILFVDDEETLVNIGQNMLARLGYQVKARTSSIEALAAFEHNPDAYDLVMTDMTMPNMTGEGLAKEILRIRPNMPIVLCTGFSHQMDQEKALGMGIRAFVMKPFVLKEVAGTIRDVLDVGNSMESSR